MEVEDLAPQQSLQSEATVVGGSPRGSTVLQQEADTLTPRKGQLAPGALQPDWRRVTFPEEVTEVKAVQTRAQKKKEAQQRKQDQEDQVMPTSLRKAKKNVSAVSHPQESQPAELHRMCKDQIH